MIISRTFPRNASVNRSRPNISSITPKLCIPSLIGVFLLGLTHPMSQFLFFDTERIRLSLFPQHSVHEPRLTMLRVCAPLQIFQGTVLTVSMQKRTHLGVGFSSF